MKLYTKCFVVLLALTINAVLAPTAGPPTSSPRLPQVNSTPSRRTSIVFVKPVFTAAAYDGYPGASFYGFYRRYANVSENAIVVSDLNLLSTSVNKVSWGASSGLGIFLRSAAKNLDLFKGATILTDIDVNDGGLFYSTNGTRRFDVAVLGFSEYVTTAEYLNYKRFVGAGGRLSLLDACNFLAEVKYDPATNKVSLVKGHGWEFNGTAAWRGPLHRWYDENTNWVGSNFALYYEMGYEMNGAVANTTHPLSELLRKTFGLRVLTSYAAHEENAVTNSSDSVIAYWDISGLESRTPTVAVYEHKYQQGVVIHTGIFASELISKDQQMQFFFVAAMSHLASQPIPDAQIPFSEFAFETLQGLPPSLWLPCCLPGPLLVDPHRESFEEPTFD